MALLCLRNLLLVLGGILAILQPSIAGGIRYVTSQDQQSEVTSLPDDRKPALYTKEFGDCLGNGLINVTRFDAAYYKDNTTVLFYLAGISTLASESVTISISVYAYGKSRFNLTFNPCDSNIGSLCPLNASVPIQVEGDLPVSYSDVSRIPSIAFKIPDFEGNAIIRIFENSMQSEIGCYIATVTNGNSFSQPASIGTILGFSTLIAFITSFATASYGDDRPAIRRHYAHSLSVHIVFAVLQHIFFTGAMSLNWPNVLLSWWNNFAWAGGMIYDDSMQSLIDGLVKSKNTNVSRAEAITLGSKTANLRRGYNLTDITSGPVLYSRLPQRRPLPEKKSNRLVKRAFATAYDNHSWSRKLGPGLPVREHYSGFAGTLARENVAASNAFMTGFLWIIILLASIAAIVVFFKWSLEVLAQISLIKQERFVYFRSHWIAYTAHAVLRTFSATLFMVTSLTLFQFSHGGSSGVLAIAALVFLTFCIGTLSVAGYACYYPMRIRNVVSRPYRPHCKIARIWNILPWVNFYYANSGEDKSRTSAGSASFWKMFHVVANTEEVLEDQDFLKKFGWLTARFRASRWWFFGPWLSYQFLEGCFHGGAVVNPLVQVVGLLVLEVLVFITIACLKPFGSQNLNALMVYILSFSKISTIALCASFDVRFNLSRITITKIGIVIIAIQGILVGCLLVTIVICSLSSYRSLTRYRGAEASRPHCWHPHRDRHFQCIGGVTSKHRHFPSLPILPKSKERKESSFMICNVRRVAKIEDEDPDNIYNSSTFAPNRKAPVDDPFAASLVDVRDPDGITPVSTEPPSILSSKRPDLRAYSGSDESIQQKRSYSSLPRAARVYRVSWNSREYLETGGYPLSTQPQSQSQPYSGYSYSGLQIRGPDPRYASTPPSFAAYSGALSLGLEVPRSLATSLPTSPSKNAKLISPKSSWKSQPPESPDPAALTEAINDAEGQAKNCSARDTKDVKESPTSSEYRKYIDHRYVSDDNEDTINGTTLFDDSNTSIPLRKEDMNMEGELKPEDSLSSRAILASFSTAAPRGSKILASSSSLPGRKQEEVQVRDQSQNHDYAHLLHRLSLGDTFALDLLFPTGSPRSGGKDGSTHVRNQEGRDDTT